MNYIAPPVDHFQIIERYNSTGAETVIYQNDVSHPAHEFQKLRETSDELGVFQRDKKGTWCDEHSFSTGKCYYFIRVRYKNVPSAANGLSTIGGMVVYRNPNFDQTDEHSEILD